MAVAGDAQGAAPTALRFESGKRSVVPGPAVKYDFSPNVGVIVGARFIRGRNTTDSVTPVVALNYVHRVAPIAWRVRAPPGINAT